MDEASARLVELVDEAHEPAWHLRADDRAGEAREVEKLAPIPGAWSGDGRTGASP